MKKYPYFKAQLITAIVIFLLSWAYLQFIHTKITSAWTADLFGMSILGLVLAPIAIIMILVVKAYVYFKYEKKKLVKNKQDFF